MIDDSHLARQVRERQAEGVEAAEQGRRNDLESMQFQVCRVMSTGGGLNPLQYVGTVRVKLGGSPTPGTPVDIIDLESGPIVANLGRAIPPVNKLVPVWIFEGTGVTFYNGI